MKNRVASMFVVLLPFACVGLFAQNSKTADKADKAEELPVAGIYFAKGAGQSHGQPSSPNLIYHGGPILPTANVEAIFWGTSWASNPGDKISGLDSFYRGISGSAYAGTCNEYNASSGNRVASTISYSGYVIDNSQAPSNGSQTSRILAEVCKMIGSNVVSNGYYPVYIDNPRVSNYCAWHTAGSCNGVTVQFAFFYKLDGDPGCDPQSTVPNQSEGLAALANVSGHELSEARTDPVLNAWYDGNGGENADKCAWTFANPYVTFPNGTAWKIQGNWSNQAYNTSSGYPNSNGQWGCIDGGGPSSAK